MWEYTGEKRPDFAEVPAAGQESVWDYPRPPMLVRANESIRVGSLEHPLALCDHALRVLETASPPTYYLPSSAIDFEQLVPVGHRSFCEWKGVATYFAMAQDPERQPIAWRYQNPSSHFAELDDHVSFYPARIECYVDGERVTPQDGEFYGGWITSRIVGPFKGAPGTGHW